MSSVEDTGQAGQATSLSEKLETLFAAVSNPRTGKPYTNAGAAEAINAMVDELPEDERAGRSISQQYIWQLRKGVKRNPTIGHLNSLAGLFGVEPDYFLSEATYSTITQELEVVAALRDAGVRDIAHRARNLSPAGLAAVRAALETARQMEMDRSSTPPGTDDADDDVPHPPQRT